MNAKKYEEKEYPVGILWNMGNHYAREIMLEIAKMREVIQVREMNLGNEYNKFVLDCYKNDSEAQEDGYIYEKIKNMKSDNKRVVAFVLQIDNPTFKRDESGKIQCIEARKIKQKIRDEYSKKIEGYFFDNIIHISDNVEESRHILDVLNQYEKYMTADYVRKGYSAVIGKVKNNSCNSSYIKLLKELKGDDEIER